MTGVAVGRATITYSATDDSDASNDESTTKRFPVTVSNARPTVGALDNLTVGIGKEKTATVTVTDSDAEDTHTVAASSSKTSVATVSVSGKTPDDRGQGGGQGDDQVLGDGQQQGSQRGVHRTNLHGPRVANSRPIVAAISDRSVAEDGTAQCDGLGHRPRRGRHPHDHGVIEQYAHSSRDRRGGRH